MVLLGFVALWRCKKAETVGNFQIERTSVCGAIIEMRKGRECYGAGRLVDCGYLDCFASLSCRRSPDVCALRGCDGQLAEAKCGTDFNF